MTPRDRTKALSLPDERGLATLTEEEIKTLTGLRRKMIQRVTFKAGAPAPIGDKPEVFTYALVAETCKSSSPVVAHQLIESAATGRCWENQDTCLAEAFSQIADLAPQTHLEAMLISQMVAVNTAIGQVMQRAMLPNQTFEGKVMNATLATKFQRTFLQQIEALQKLRGKGQQTVRVEHVTVNAGGQAIVGTVEQKPRGEG